MAAEVIQETLSRYSQTVKCCMERAGIEKLLADKRPVMLKPNLVNATPHPVTTPPEFCEAVIDLLRQYCDVTIVIAEGCGDVQLTTWQVFDRLGYRSLAGRMDVELVDLNESPLVLCQDDNCRRFPQLWLPQLVFNHLLISLPVLKAHSLCRFSGSMKNMMGIIPPRNYQGQYGTWKKAAFHSKLDEAIVALNNYRAPDFTVMDASIGLSEYHLGGPTCDPPVNRILAGFDARAVDREAAALLGLQWERIGHLK